MDSKDRRAMHADRQQALHASDRRKGKGGRTYKPRGGDSRNHYADSTVDDFPVTPFEKEDSIWPEPIDSPDVGATLPIGAPQVSLAEIIKPGRKRKGVAGDFEIVPRPGEVLTLPMNEGFEDENDDLYAGWEDISTGALRDTSVSHESGTGVALTGTPPRFPPVSYAAALSARH